MTHSNALNQYQLKKANLIINQFIISCSHSLRGPLKSIEGLVNLLQGCEGNHETDTNMFLSLIGSTTMKMENVLDELEELLENSRREISVKKIIGHRLVNKVIARFDKEIKAKNVEISVTISQPCPLRADGPRLFLILSHLLENAIEFQDASKLQHKVHLRMRVCHGSFLLEVEDNGIGIPTGELDKIFGLFYRSSEQSKGAGVGLYVVKEAVEKMGGKVSVQSAIGTGSTFSVKLPNLAS